MKHHTTNISHYQVVFDSGGIGDCTARLVPFLYMSKYYHPVIAHLFVPDYFVDFAKRCLDKRYVVRGFSSFQKKFNKSLPHRTFGVHQYNNLASSMVQHAYAIVLNTQMTQPEHLNYPLAQLDDVQISHFNLPEKYAVFAVGFTSPVREWLPEHINATVAHVVAKGYTPVFLGSSAAYNGVAHTIKPVFRKEIDYSSGLNLTDKTTIVEAAKIMKHSAFVVGLDSGLLHIAAASRTDLPIVSGYTTVRPESRAPYREDVYSKNWYSVHLPEGSTPCLFQQNDHLMKWNFDFKLHNENCKNNECLKLLDHTYYIEAINKILAKQ